MNSAGGVACKDDDNGQRYPQRHYIGRSYAHSSRTTGVTGDQSKFFNEVTCATLSTSPVTTCYPARVTERAIAITEHLALTLPLSCTMLVIATHSLQFNSKTFTVFCDVYKHVYCVSVVQGTGLVQKCAVTKSVTLRKAQIGCTAVGSG